MEVPSIAATISMSSLLFIMNPLNLSSSSLLNLFQSAFLRFRITLGVSWGVSIRYSMYL